MSTKARLDRVVEHKLDHESESREAPTYDYEKAAAARSRVFAYDIVVFFVLILLAWSYFRPPGDWSIRDLVPTDLQGLPVYAFWFGALGGIVISLKGIYDHGPRDWQMTYNLWHFGRPISGGIAGGVIYLLLSAVGGSSAPPQPSIVLAAAFIVGTQEKRFFNFLSEIARIVVRAPNDALVDELMISEIHPLEGPAQSRLLILGQGFDPGLIAWVGSSRLENVVVSRDGTTVTGTIPNGTGEAVIRVENPDGAARVVKTRFIYRANGSGHVDFSPREPTGAADSSG